MQYITGKLSPKQPKRALHIRSSSFNITETETRKKINPD